MSSLPGALYAHDAMGNPLHPILSPNFLLKFTIESPTFYERFTSVMFNIILTIYNRYYIIPKSNAIARKYYGNNIPSLGDIRNNMSLFLITKNCVQNEISPNVPGVVDMSLLHIKVSKPLPKDIKEFLDKSKKGVVYFSMGTNRPTYEMCKHKMELIEQVLLSLPYNVLWKSNINTTISRNIMIKDWVPQNDVLAHPNIKLFITQGGLHSLEESIYNAVPLVLLPVYADQAHNSKRIASKGMGIVLDIFAATKEKLTNTIIEVAESKKYKEAALRLSKIIKDQPMIGVDKPVWWVEYIIRHKGGHHLRSGFIGMPFYQYYLLDVIGFIGLSVVISVFVLYKLVSCFRNFKRVNTKIKMK